MVAGSSPATTWITAIAPSAESHEVGSIPQQLRPCVESCAAGRRTQGLNEVVVSLSLHDFSAKSMEGKLFLGNVPAEAMEDDLRSIFCAVEGLIEARGIEGSLPMSM